MNSQDLKAWRKARTWSQGLMAARTGFSTRVLHKYESGDQPVPLKLVLALEAIDMRELLATLAVGADTLPATIGSESEAVAAATRFVQIAGDFVRGARALVTRTAEHLDEGDEEG